MQISKRSDHGYKVGDKSMLDNHSAYKYETPYKGPFFITQYWTNNTVTLQFGAIKFRYNIRHINSHTYGKNVKNNNLNTNY